MSERINLPLVSVVIPVFNRENTVVVAVDSVLEQTYDNIEIIVVNDASTDNTENVLFDNYKDKVKYLKNEKNMGVSFSRNKGIENANGEYIAFLDSDDIWFPFHIEEAIEEMQHTRRSVCCALWTENYYGKKFDLCQSPYFKKIHRDKLKNELGVSVDDPLWIFPPSIYEYILKTDFYFYQINTLVLKKSVIDDIGYFDESMKASEDMDLCYRIFRKYPPITINKSHFMYNYGHDNLWAFADREKELSEFSDDEKGKMKFTTLQKIEFYKKILERVDSDNSLSNIYAIKENICSNIVKRYMTLRYLFNCYANIDEISKYAITDKLKQLTKKNESQLDEFLILD